MKRREIVAPHPRTPRAVDLRDDPVLELERRVGGIFCGRLVRLARFVEALRDVRRADAGDAFHAVEELIQHIAPMT